MELHLWWWWWMALAFIEYLRADISVTNLVPSCAYIEEHRIMECVNVTLKVIHIGEYPINNTRTERLYLQNTSLATLEANTFSQLSELSLLDLSENFLRTLDYRSFNNLTNLVFLYLNNNNLTSLTDGRLFQPLINLKYLRLHDNQIERLYVDVLIPLTKLKSLILYVNPFICDCHLFPTIQWCQKKIPGITASCKYPKDYLWNQINFTECEDDEETHTSAEYNKEDWIFLAKVLGATIVLVLMCFLQITIYCLLRKTSTNNEDSRLIDEDQLNLGFYYEEVVSTTQNNIDNYGDINDHDLSSRNRVTFNSFHLYEEIDNGPRKPRSTPVLKNSTVSDGSISNNLNPEKQLKEKNKCAQFNGEKCEVSIPQTIYVENSLYLAEQIEYLPTYDYADENSICQ
ncbi:leucine-rich repeat-containing protein 38-like [Periplaneta americana]|uniref:leucine-rich repeat-containing protein 38-like n=1 Tax=Periplaneta americana TaxID=6978 RepID=UPI0037E77733